MTIKSETATVFRGANGRRFITRKAAARSLATQAYRKKYGYVRCGCNNETGQCEWCQYYGDHQKVIQRYARILLRRKEAANG